MTEKDSSALPFGCAQEERTDEVPSCEEPNPCAEDVVEEEGEGEEPRELAGAGKNGIVYLSRIPPFMKPLKVRHLLSQYGEVGRVFLQPEDPVIRKRRKKFGGNKKRNYTEGWVEFSSRRVARMVAVMLNNRPIGGKKRSYYHDDLWNVKYLPKFKWTHLTEKIVYEQAVREQRIRTEVSQVKRENAFYMKNVDKSRAISAIIERKRKKSGEGGSEDPPSSSPSIAKRSFKQRHVVWDSGPSKRGLDQSSGSVSDSLLNMIFTGSA